jgi:hypothetical protein
VAWPFMPMACYFGPSYYTLPHRVLLPKISRVGANLTATAADEGVFLLFSVESTRQWHTRPPSWVGGGCVSTGVTVMELAAGTFCKHVQGQQTRVYFCCFLWIPCRGPRRGVGVVVFAPHWIDARPPPTYKGWLCFVRKSLIVLECGMCSSLAVVSHVA